MEKEIEDTVRQPQFQQAAGIFGYAFGTGQLAPVLEQFGLPEAAVLAAANGGTVQYRLIGKLLLGGNAHCRRSGCGSARAYLFADWHH